MTVTVPAAPPLATVRAVPLMHAGQWSAQSGVHEFSTEDLAAAVAAMDCPATRRPALKFGHDGQHGVGMPALGSVDNLALDDDGRTLLGDYVGMPGWLATIDAEGRSVLSSAYPDRSIEGEWGYRCAIGHTHPFVVHAVALLGEERPAIGTLPSLTDLADLYGVALANPAPTGTPVTLTIRSGELVAEAIAAPTDISLTTTASAEAGERSTMPNPSPTKVAATVTSEDVRRAYYDDADWEYWITELQIDPNLQLIVTSDRTGEYSRIPVVIDGDTVTFGDAVPVSIVYVDKAPAANAAQAAAMTVMASAALSGQRLIYATRAESRPGEKPTAAGAAPESAPTVEPAAADDTPEELPAAEPEPEPDTTEDDMSDLSEIRSRLGLPDDADEAAILAALDARLPQPNIEPDPVQDPVVVPEPEPVAASTGNTEYAAELSRVSAELAEIKAERQRAVKASLFDGAVRLGQIEPATRAAWEARYDKAPDVIAEILASIAPGTAVPITAAGTTGTGDETLDSGVLTEAEKALFTTSAKG